MVLVFNNIYSKNMASEQRPIYITVSSANQRSAAECPLQEKAWPLGIVYVIYAILKR